MPAVIPGLLFTYLLIDVLYHIQLMGHCSSKLCACWGGGGGGRVSGLKAPPFFWLLIKRCEVKAGVYPSPSFPPPPHSDQVTWLRVYPSQQSKLNGWESWSLSHSVHVLARTLMCLACLILISLYCSCAPLCSCPTFNDALNCIVNQAHDCGVTHKEEQAN